MRKISLLALLASLFCCLGVHATEYYIIGGFNGWATADPNCQFSATSTDGVYELNYSGTLTSGFKVNDGTWTNDNFNFGR